MRALILRALVVSVCAFCVAGPAVAQQQPADQTDWIVRGEALARRIEAGNLIITEDQIDEVVAILDDSLATVAAEISTVSELSD